MSAGMAYEAMNNAGALGSRLIVILNDNDMSIAPPVGAMSAYLARLVSGRTYRSHPRDRQASGRAAAALLPRQGQAHRGICPRLLDRRHAVRGARLLLCRADRRPQSRPSAARAAQCPRRRRRADPGPCRDAEGQGLCPGRGERRQVPRRRQVRPRHRPAGQGAGQCAELYRRLRQCADQGRARRTRRSSPSPPPCRRAPGSTRSARSFPAAPSMSASPSSMR